MVGYASRVNKGEMMQVYDNFFSICFNGFESEKYTEVLKDIEALINNNKEINALGLLCPVISEPPKKIIIPFYKIQQWQRYLKGQEAPKKVAHYLKFDNLPREYVPMFLLGYERGSDEFLDEKILRGVRFDGFDSLSFVRTLNVVINAAMLHEDERKLSYEVASCQNYNSPELEDVIARINEKLVHRSGRINVEFKEIDELDSFELNVLMSLMELSGHYEAKLKRAYLELDEIVARSNLSDSPAPIDVINWALEKNIAIPWLSWACDNVEGILINLNNKPKSRQKVSENISAIEKRLDKLERFLRYKSYCYPQPYPDRRRSLWNELSILYPDEFEKCSENGSFSEVCSSGKRLFAEARKRELIIFSN